MDEMIELLKDIKDLLNDVLQSVDRMDEHLESLHASLSVEAHGEDPTDTLAGIADNVAAIADALDSVAGAVQENTDALQNMNQNDEVVEAVDNVNDTLNEIIQKMEEME